MVYKAFISYYEPAPINQNAITYDIQLWNETTEVSAALQAQNLLDLPTMIGAPYTAEKIKATVLASAIAWAAGQGFTITENDCLFLGGPSIAAVYEGTTRRDLAFPIFKSATVASGVAAFHLTVDGLSTGAALFKGGVIQDSVNAFVSDAAASYQMSYVFSNSNKTVTVTTNKLTTANILSGILGQAAANGSVVKLSVFGY